MVSEFSVICRYALLVVGYVAFLFVFYLVSFHILKPMSNKQTKITEAAQNQKALPCCNDGAGSYGDARSLDVGIAECRGASGWHTVSIRQPHAASIKEEGQSELDNFLLYF